MAQTPVYVINLPESSDRRSAMERQAEVLGVEVTFFEAVDGRQEHYPLFSKVDQSKRLRYKGRPFKPGELGVWASHYRLWEACLESGLPMVILEDDAVLEPNFADFLESAPTLARRFPYFRLYASERPSKQIATLEGFGIHRYWKNPLRTTGYLIAPEAARKLLAKADPWVLPVDDYMDLPWLHGVDCLGIKPGCVSDETQFASTIQPRAKAPKERLTPGQKLMRESFRHYLRLRYCLDYIKRSFK